MALKKGGLGRNLGSLIGEMGQSVLDQPEFEVLKQIAIDRIQASSYQPRKNFDEVGLKELTLSIVEHGILQPLVVRPVGGECYEIIAGERRFRAGKEAGLSKVPCVVKNYDDHQALAIALIENLQRSDLNALEVAQGLSRLVEEFTLTHEQVAKLIGRSRSSVTNTLRLLELSDTVKQALNVGKIEMGHARAMLALSEEEQGTILGEILRKNFTVRQTEARIKQLQQPPSLAEKPPMPDVIGLEQSLSKLLGTKVNIQQKKKGNGTVLLRYKNEADLAQLLQKLGYEKK